MIILLYQILIESACMASRTSNEPAAARAIRRRIAIVYDYARSNSGTYLYLCCFYCKFRSADDRTDVQLYIENIVLNILIQSIFTALFQIIFLNDAFNACNSRTICNHYLFVFRY